MEANTSLGTFCTGNAGFPKAALEPFAPPLHLDAMHEQTYAHTLSPEKKSKVLCKVHMLH